MENKLTLAHLAPYLPYGVNFRFNLKDVYDEYPNEIRDKILTCNSIDLCISIGKPILRPLSDLSKNENFWHIVNIMDDNFGEYVTVDSDCDIDVDCDGGCGRYVSLHDCYNAYTELFKNHFDVFGLIEKGLAVDINTIEND